MANTITRIVAYPQVLCYKKKYIDALLDNDCAEPTGANGQNFAAFFSPKVGGGIYYRKLNPYVLDENMQSVVIAENINHDLSDVPVEIDYSDVIELFQTACEDGQYYAHNTNKSTAYKIMQYNMEDYLVPVNPRANVPLFLRYIYSVTYAIQGTEVTVNFPTTANTYYETVLNALNNWQFTPNQGAQKQKGANSITFYDEEGEVLEEQTFDSNNSVTYNITSLPVYLGVEVALRGHRSAALNCFNERYFLSGEGGDDIDLGTNLDAPEESALSTVLGSIWSQLCINNNMVEPRTSADPKAPPSEDIDAIDNVTYKFSTTYKRLVAAKIDRQVNGDYFLAVRNEADSGSVGTGMLVQLSTTITVPSVSLVANVLTLSKDTMPTQTVAKIVNTLPNSITNVKRKFKLMVYATRAAGSTTDFSAGQYAPGGGKETAFVDQDDIPAGETQMYDFSIEDGVEGTSAIEKMFNMFGMTTLTGGTSTICSAVYVVKCIVQFDYLGVTYTKETPFTVFLGMAEEGGIKITQWIPKIEGGKWIKTTYNLTVKTCSAKAFCARSSFLISLKDHAIIFAQGERELKGEAIKDISLTSASSGSFTPGAQCAFTGIEVVNHPNAISGVISSRAKSRLTLKSPDGHKGSTEAVDIEGAWDDLSVSTNYTVTVPDEVETDDASEGVVSSGA